MIFIELASQIIHFDICYKYGFFNRKSFKSFETLSLLNSSYYSVDGVRFSFLYSPSYFNNKLLVSCSVHAYIVFKTEEAAQTSLAHNMAVVCCSSDC